MLAELHFGGSLLILDMLRIGIDLYSALSDSDFAVKT